VIYKKCYIADTQGMYTELKAFIEESALMCSFNHPHVLGMVGICLDTVQSPYLLLPYMANGDLRTFLRNKRESSKNTDNGYPEAIKFYFAIPNSD
jgi:serine/threonine protein kinase